MTYFEKMKSLMRLKNSKAPNLLPSTCWSSNVRKRTVPKNEPFSGQTLFFPNLETTKLSIEPEPRKY